MRDRFHHFPEPQESEFDTEEAGLQEVEGE